MRQFQSKASPFCSQSHAVEKSRGNKNAANSFENCLSRIGSGQFQPQNIVGVITEIRSIGGFEKDCFLHIRKTQ
jgi:hypothetical protein